MKRLIPLLTCLTLLSVMAGAQTSAAPTAGTLLEIHRFWWQEAAHYSVDDLSGATEAARRYRDEHRAGRGDYAASVVLKNAFKKTIKSVSLDLVFRDTATGREFLTYHLRSDRKIGPGEKREIRHKIARGQEPDNFLPAAPGAELLSRTRSCGDGPLLRDRKSGKLLVIREDEKLLRMYPCYYLPAVTRIEYADGSVWEP
jgi:hypothetical protein